MNEDAKLGHVRCYCAQEIYHTSPSEWIQLRAKFFAMLKSSCVQKQVVNDKRILSKTEVYVLATFNIYNSQYYQI
jgi:hypothetical protein